MKRSPLEAFNRYLELAPDMKSAYASPSSRYFELLDAFLVNPEQHREHVQLIAEAACFTAFAEKLPLIHPSRGPLRFFVRNNGFSETYWSRVQSLRRGLIETAQPGEFSFDILPSKLVETPPEWAEELQLHLLEARLAIHPSSGLVPDRVSFRLEFEEDAVRFSDCFPSTEFSEMGEYEVGVTSEAKFVRSENVGGSVNIGTKTPILEASVAAEGSAGTEDSESRSSAYTFKYPAKVLKFVSSAVGRRARWEMLRAGDESPTGGLVYLAALIAPKALTELHATGSFEVSLDGWGDLTMPFERVVTLSRMT